MMVIERHIHSSLLSLMFVFPTLDNLELPPAMPFEIYLFISLKTTFYTFAKASLLTQKALLWF
jgi:hypothetical protein